MTTATRATKQVIKTYKSVLTAQAITRTRLITLLENNPLYNLFEHDKFHPYYPLLGKANEVVNDFEKLISGIGAWTIGSSSISEELDKSVARQIVEEEEIDVDVENLRRIESEIVTTELAADLLVPLVINSFYLVNFSDDRAINQNLMEQHGKKNVSRHKEFPVVNTIKDCRAAMREIKKLAKELMGCGNGSTTLRFEMEEIQKTLIATGKQRAWWIDELTKV